MSSSGDFGPIISREDLEREVRLLRRASQHDKEERDQLRSRIEDLVKKNDFLEDENAVLQGRLDSLSTFESPRYNHPDPKQLIDQLADAQEEIRRLNAENAKNRSDLSPYFNEFFDIQESQFDIQESQFEASRSQIEKLRMIKKIAVSSGFVDQPQASGPLQLGAPSPQPKSESTEPRFVTSRGSSLSFVKEEESVQLPSDLSKQFEESMVIQPEGNQFATENPLSQSSGNLGPRRTDPPGSSIFSQGTEDQTDLKKRSLAFLQSLRNESPQSSFASQGPTTGSFSFTSGDSRFPQSDRGLKQDPADWFAPGREGPPSTRTDHPSSSVTSPSVNEPAGQGEAGPVRPNAPVSHHQVGSAGTQSQILTRPGPQIDPEVIRKKREEEERAASASLTGASSAHDLSVIPDFNKPVTSGPVGFPAAKAPTGRAASQQQTGKTAPVPADSATPQTAPTVVTPKVSAPVGPAQAQAGQTTARPRPPIVEPPQIQPETAATQSAPHATAGQPGPTPAEAAQAMPPPGRGKKRNRGGSVRGRAQGHGGKWSDTSSDEVDDDLLTAIREDLAVTHNPAAATEPQEEAALASEGSQHHQDAKESGEGRRKGRGNRGILPPMPFETSEQKLFDMATKPWKNLG
ncbi:MAG: hypothetical protein L6R41_001054 [Letrouitia leprolyta]|nr:MAG: hypothetical protein L6R41_001054 [Letrouitia leprolyta]